MAPWALHYLEMALPRLSVFFLGWEMSRFDVSDVCWMYSLGSLSDHPEKAGALQEKESQWLLGRLGKCELFQVAFANERKLKAGSLSPP